MPGEPAQRSCWRRSGEVSMRRCRPPSSMRREVRRRWIPASRAYLQVSQSQPTLGVPTASPVPRNRSSMLPGRGPPEHVPVRDEGKPALDVLPLDPAAFPDEGREEGLLDEDPEVCTGEALGHPGELPEIPVPGEGVCDLREDCLPHPGIGEEELDYLVEPAPGRLVQELGVVRRREEEDPVADEAYPVDVLEEHVHRPLHGAVVIGDPTLRHEVELVDEEDGGGDLLCKFEDTIDVL